MSDWGFRVPVQRCLLTGPQVAPGDDPECGDSVRVVVFFHVFKRRTQILFTSLRCLRVGRRKSRNWFRNYGVFLR